MNVLLPKMRTLPEAAKELKAQDPQTPLTYPVLRRLVKSGKIPFVTSGRRTLINMADLENLCVMEQPEPIVPAKIRRIAE